MDTQAPVRPPASQVRGRSRRARDLVSRIWTNAVLPVLGIAITLAVWWSVTAFFEIRPLFLPSPGSVLEVLWESPQYFTEATWITFYQTAAGFGVATAGGLTTAVLLVSSRTLERAAMPLVVSLHAIPKVALTPLLIIWLGFGASPKIALAALISFFPIVVATMAGLNATPADLGELARSLSASRIQTFVKIRAPWALPQVFIGLKVAMTLALIGTIVAQIQNPTGGLGAAIAQSNSSANTAIAFAAIAALLVLSLAMFYGIVALERLLLPWARATRAAAHA